jgi:Protein kinase domain
MTGQMLGTPAFMPPEQFTGAPVDGRADIFSLGVVLYWMATGEQPFPGESMTAVSYKVVHTEPVPPRKLNPSVPAKLDAIIMKCLAKSPADRYQTGDELALDLSALRAGPNTSTLQSPAPRKSVAEIDPEATVMVSTPVPAGRVAGPNQQVATLPAKSHRDTWLILAAIIMAAVAGGGDYALRRPAKIADAPAPSPVETTSTSPPLPASAPVPVPEPVSAAASDSAPAEPTTDKGVVAASVSAPPAAAPKKKPIVAAAPVPPAVAPTKPDAKTPVAAEPAPPPKVAEAAPTASALGFDPTALDPKQNAKLRIDASQLPADLSFTVEMNGKIYLRKADAATKVQDRDFFVPPGVQEFRVTASNGAIEKSSNTVSTEFKAKKKNTLKIELRTEGAPPGAGIPQGIYRDTQIVVNLK